MKVYLIGKYMSGTASKISTLKVYDDINTFITEELFKIVYFKDGYQHNYHYCLPLGNMLKYHIFPKWTIYWAELNSSFAEKVTHDHWKELINSYIETHKEYINENEFRRNKIKGDLNEGN